MSFLVSPSSQRPKSNCSAQRPSSLHARPTSPEAGQGCLPATSLFGQPGAHDHLYVQSAWLEGGRLPLPTKVQPVLRNLRAKGIETKMANCYGDHQESARPSSQGSQGSPKKKFSLGSPAMSFGNFLQEARGGQSVIAAHEQLATAQHIVNVKAARYENIKATQRAVTASPSYRRRLAALTQDLDCRPSSPTSDQAPSSPSRKTSFLLDGFNSPMSDLSEATSPTGDLAGKRSVAFMTQGQGDEDSTPMRRGSDEGRLRLDSAFFDEREDLDGTPGGQSTGSCGQPSIRREQGRILKVGPDCDKIIGNESSPFQRQATRFATGGGMGRKSSSCPTTLEKDHDFHKFSSSEGDFRVRADGSPAHRAAHKKSRAVTWSAEDSREKGSPSSLSPRPKLTPTSKRSMTWELNRNRQTRTMLQGAAEVHVLDKKANAQQALANDRALTVKCMPKENASQRAMRNMRVEGRRLEMLFVPIPKPFDHIPSQFKNFAVTSRMPARFTNDQLIDMQRVELTSKESSSVETLCDAFSSLLRPFVAPGEVEATPVLTRAALCRLLVDANITDDNGNLVYHAALDIFDSLAQQHIIKGTPLTSGRSHGLVHDEKLSLFFSNALLLAGRDDGKTLWIEGPLVGAMRKTRRRFRHITRQVAKGKAIFMEFNTKNESIAKTAPASPTKGDVSTEMQSTASAPGAAPAPSDEAQAETNELDTKSIASRTKSKNSIESDDLRNKSKEPETLKTPKNRKDAQDYESQQSGQSVPSKRAPSRAASKQRHDEDDEQEEEVKEVVKEVVTEDVPDKASDCGSSDVDDSGPRVPEEQLLYAHTCMVSKGELLSCMLLEPEALHLTWLFYGSFKRIFDAYADRNTTFLTMSSASDGHMSNAAFVHCCADLGLYPKLVDFNTLQCMYWSAEGGVELSRADLKQCTTKNTLDAEFHHGEIVQLPPTSRRDCVHGVHDIKYADPLKVVEVDVSDVDCQACRVMTQRGKLHWIRVSDLACSDKPYVLREGKKHDKQELPCKLGWLGKEFDDMSDVEMRSMAILSIVADHMLKHHLRARDLFSLYDKSSDGEIDMAEMQRAIRHLALDDPPEPDEVAQMFHLIDINNSSTLDYLEFDSVLRSVDERKARHRNKYNIFLKDRHKMNSAEKAADSYFVPLEKELRERGWSADDFIHNFQVDGKGELGMRDLLRAGKKLGLTITDAAHFERGLMCVDPNFDGALTTKELTEIMKYVAESLQKKDEALLESQNPFAQELDADRESSTVKVFGVKAFIESLMKIGLGYTSFHGTPEQSELATQAKVLWFFTYINWQTSLRSDEPQAKTDARKAWSKKATSQRQGARLSLGSQMKEMLRHGFKPIERRMSRQTSPSAPAPEVPLEAAPRAEPVAAAAAASPLAHLLENGAKLFEETGGPPDLLGASFERREKCSACQFEPLQGWGKPSCSKCGLGDDILRACLAMEAPESLPILHQIVAMLGTKAVGSSPGASMSQSFMSSTDFGEKGSTPISP